MTLDLTELKKIKLSERNLLFGYYREAHQNLLPQNNPYYDIQPLIVYVCLAYYHIKLEWDTKHLGNNCVVDGEYIAKTVTGDTTSLLNEEITNGIHQYKFKIISWGGSQDTTSFWDVGIGIISLDWCNPDKLKNKCYQEYPEGYGYHTSKARAENNSLITRYGTYCKRGDIVTMTVDLENHQIAYKVNDKDLGVAYNQIESKTYRIALYLFNEGAKVQILNS